MGDEVRLAGPPSFDIHVVGTNDIAKIDVLRDSEVVETLRLKGTTFKGIWRFFLPRPIS